MKAAIIIIIKEGWWKAGGYEGDGSRQLSRGRETFDLWGREVDVGGGKSWNANWKCPSWYGHKRGIEFYLLGDGNKIVHVYLSWIWSKVNKIIEIF